MGIPKFFRWAAERYPQVITPFKENPPPMDNLYLDMNGIIHHCTHPNDFDARKKTPSEKEMVAAMFGYIEKLFAAIQPKKYFLMAVDGVAPRAKMNQQRQRRYRAGYEMMVAREEALAMGEELPDEGDVFDSNCITPGTEFMFRISEHIQYFITMKIHNDSAWRNCTVIYSGHDNPGEGEHKIMDFVRRRKMQPDYTANETHCMYGLDADLMMLALATHEPHFVLLREVVSFGGGTKRDREKKEADAAKGLVESKTLAKAESFVLFHINLFREYLEMDLKRDDQISDFDFERVVDDFVFLCFFIGNDFLPPIPTLAINDGAMTTMVDIYREVCLKKGTYMTREGKANWNSVEMFLGKLGELELETLRARQADEIEYRKRQAQRADFDHEVNQTPVRHISSIAEYKERYYGEKLKFDEAWNPRGDEMAELRQHYVEGLMWVMEYYYRGPPSWKWFYPHHYAPMASDLISLSNYGSRVHFDKGVPFLPHQQLLAVLPPMSARSMPQPYWTLLQSNNSPLKKFFPSHIEIDKEGARNPWEGTVLIPFLDEKDLLVAYDSVQGNLSEEDRQKNRNTNNLIFKHSQDVRPYNVPSAMFETLHKVQIERKSYKFPEAPSFVPRLMPGVRVGDAGGMEGLGTFHSKMHLMKPHWEAGIVNVFGMPARKESLILKFESSDGLTPNTNRSAPPTADDFSYLIGQRVWIAFPLYKRARVTAITDARCTLQSVWNKEGNLTTIDRKDHNGDAAAAFKKDVGDHLNALKTKGIMLQEIPLLIHVHRHIDMRVSKSGRLVAQYSRKETVYPMQLISPIDKVNLIEDARHIERDRSESDYQIGSDIMYIGAPPKGLKLPGGGAADENPCFGMTGYVMEKLEDDRGFDIQLNVLVDGGAASRIPNSIKAFSDRNKWTAMHQVADRVGISSSALSQITSSVVTTAQFGSRELGLCLKFTGKELARIGYSKMVQTHFNPWYVSRPNLFGYMAEDEDDVVTGYHMHDPANTQGKKQEKGAFNRGSHANASGRGTWYFSEDAVDLIREYCTKFAPLIRRMEEGNNAATLEPQSFLIGEWAQRDVMEVLQSIETWFEEKGIHKVPMAAAGDDCLPDSEVANLENHLNNLPAAQEKGIRLKHVQRRNLYFPTVRLPEGFVTAVPLPVKDQRFVIGSRIAHVRTSGNVPFGALGTVIRLLQHGQSAEVVFDEPYVGGSTFGGRLKTNCGSLVKLQAMLLLGESKGSGGGNGNEGFFSPEMGSTMPSSSPGTMLLSGNNQQQQQQQLPGSPASPFNLSNWAKQQGITAAGGGGGGSSPPPAATGNKKNSNNNNNAASPPTAGGGQSPPPSFSAGINVADFISGNGAKKQQQQQQKGFNVAQAIGRQTSPTPNEGDGPVSVKASGDGKGVNMAELAGKMRNRGAGSATPETSPATKTTGGQEFGQSGGKNKNGGGDVPKPRSAQAQQPSDEMNLLAAIQAQTDKAASQQQQQPRKQAPQPPAHVDTMPSPGTINPPTGANSTFNPNANNNANLGPVPQGRLTEDSIGRMMAEMVKRQLDQRYGA